MCLPLMNSLNKDLEFTAEVAGYFENNRLPTLDFEMWLEPNGKINHSFFQKPMKTKLVTMKRSAMSQHQKISIISNEIIRRLSNVNHMRVEKKEIMEVVEGFTREMKNSGYDQKETRRWL